MKKIKSILKNILNEVYYQYIGFRLDITLIIEHLQRNDKKISDLIERNEVLTNRLDKHYDELNDKCYELENDLDNYEYELSNKIKTLENVNKSAIDIKIDDVANELLLSEFSRYLADNCDVFDYDYKSIQQDLLLALIDSKDYTISIKRRIK